MGGGGRVVKRGRRKKKRNGRTKTNIYHRKTEDGVGCGRKRGATHGTKIGQRKIWDRKVRWSDKQSEWGMEQQKTARTGQKNGVGKTDRGGGSEREGVGRAEGGRHESSCSGLPIMAL